MVFLRPSGTAATYFARCDESAGPATRSHTRRAPWMHPRALFLSRPRSRYRTCRPACDRRHRRAVARIGLGALGRLMLLFGAAGWIADPASYVGSQPAPGVTLARGPSDRARDAGGQARPGSSLSLIRLAGNSSIGECPRDVEMASRLAPDDPERRTIEGVPARTLSPACIAWPGGRGPPAVAAPTRARSPSASQCRCRLTRPTTSIP